MRINGRVRLKDLRAISQQEFDTAIHICEVIKKIVELRASYIETHALNPDIALPAANWEEDSHSQWWYDIYRFVLTHEYDTINNLRLYTQAFTGYELMSMSFSRYIPLNAIGKGPVKRVPDNFDEIIDELAPKPDKFVTGYIDITRRIPKWMIAKTPKCLGEIGWDVDGSPVNYDVYSYQERLNFLYEAGIMNWLRRKVETEAVVNILEIGGGAGGLAYQIKRILPKANYFICDIPESLLFSSLYLGITRSDCKHTIYDATDKSVLDRNDCGFKFIPNFMFDDIVAAQVKVDLAINTLSFSEMSEKQVRYYAEKLRMILGDTGLIFEQNQDNRPQGCCYSKEILCDYFVFRETIRPRTTVGKKVTGGEVDVWANSRISDIIDPSLKPFDSMMWRMYYKIRSWPNLLFPRSKELLKKLIGLRCYKILKGWWNWLKNSNLAI